jgi:hypothetical protein
VSFPIQRVDVSGGAIRGNQHPARATPAMLRK